jgi:hypothetical protein
MYEFRGLIINVRTYLSKSHQVRMNEKLGGKECSRKKLKKPEEHSHEEKESQETSFFSTIGK